MITNIKQLSKEELLNLILNNIDNIGFRSKVDCATCGSPDAEFYYICDECNEALKND